MGERQREPRADRGICETVLQNDMPVPNLILVDASLYID